jgi:hypothetical protein
MIDAVEQRIEVGESLPSVKCPEPADSQAFASTIARV